MPEYQDSCRTEVHFSSFAVPASGMGIKKHIQSMASLLMTVLSNRGCGMSKLVPTIAIRAQSDGGRHPVGNGEFWVKCCHSSPLQF